MEYLTLNTGDQVPVLGFGTYLSQLPQNKFWGLVAG